MSASNFAYIANYLWQKSMDNINTILTDEERRKFSIADYYYLTTVYYMNRPNFGEVAERLGVTRPPLPEKGALIYHIRGIRAPCRGRSVPIGTEVTAAIAAGKGANAIAIFHHCIKIISRGKGASAVAKAAYRAGQFHCEYDGRTHDYTRKGGIVFREILLPDHAPPAYRDRATLWNAVEKIEKAKNSQLAREIEIAIPAELTYLQQTNLIREYVRKTFVDKGMCADIAIHDKNDGNPHAHIMLTMRPLNEDGTWGGKQKKEYTLDGKGNKIYDPVKRSHKCKSIPATDWNEHTKAEEWRAAWADVANRYLEQAGHPERIDHRSYERQGIEQIPTVHLGVAAFQMEKRGIATERGDINREIEVTNSQIRQLRARISKLRDWLKEAEAVTPPTFAEVIEAILLKRQGQGRYKQIRDLKLAANTLNFIRENNIQDLAGFRDKVGEFYGRQSAIGGRLNTIEKRMKTLAEHIRQSENYKAYRGHKLKNDKLYSQYEALEKAAAFGTKRKTQKALDAANEYRENFRMELTLYETAERYLKGVLNGKTITVPLGDWQAERAGLTAERRAQSAVTGLQYAQRRSEASGNHTPPCRGCSIGGKAGAATNQSAGNDILNYLGRTSLFLSDFIIQQTEC